MCLECRRRQVGYNQALKKLVMDHYGGVCECCGESEIAFLGIDHVDGGGNAHRRSLGVGGAVFYKWLKRHNFPKEVRLRVLCHNCNHGRYFNGGVCPHQEKRIAAKN